MPQPLDERSSPQRWLFILLIAGLILITALFLLSRLFLYSGPELMNSPYSISKAHKFIELGSVRLKVPENIIRHAKQRVSAPQDKLDLVMIWPEMEGFSLGEQVAFNDVSDNSRLIFISLSAPGEPLSTSDRLFSIYSEHFAGDPLDGPAGLIGFEMQEKSGYAGEKIYFKPNEDKPFVARCMTPVQGTAPFCLRDLIGQNGLQISYRIRPHMLDQWASLDDLIMSKVQELTQ